jgi:anti-sigma-K factor RskA
VAVLADGKADASMLVTFDPRHQQLVLQRVSGFKEADNKSLQLWALPQQGAPRSWGSWVMESLSNSLRKRPM